MREHMEEAVQAYQKTHDGEAPIVNSTVISVNGSNVLESEDYYAIAVCREESYLRNAF